jgi:erythromycin esterase
MQKRGRTSGSPVQEGLVFFLLCLYLLLANPQPVHAATSDDLTTWIQQHAVPFSRAEPGGSDADLQPLQQMIGTAQVVGLGEETHGTHEFFAMKARVIEYLVTHMGFTAFAMENDWGASKEVDAYINGGSRDIWSILRNDLFVTWRTQEVKDLLEWLRSYNANPAHTHKVHFYGIDIQGIERPTVDGVLNYLRQVDPAQVEIAHTIYQEFITDNQFAGGWQQYANLHEADMQRYKDDAQEVYNLLLSNQAEYAQHSSAQAFAQALQDARIVVQYAVIEPNRASPPVTAPNFWYVQRDPYMAENALWLQQHGVGRMVLWAHDYHTANDAWQYILNATNIQGTMGAYLRHWLGPDYLSVGMTFSRGAFNDGFFTHLSTNTITAFDPTSLNGVLGSVNTPRYMLNLRHAPASGPVYDWLTTGQTLRLIGTYEGVGEDRTYRPGEAFDILINFHDVHASQMLNTQASVATHQPSTITQGNNYWAYIISGVLLLIVLPGGLILLLNRRRRPGKAKPA